jgi:hypothetical protein
MLSTKRNTEIARRASMVDVKAAAGRLGGQISNGVGAVAIRKAGRNGQHGHDAPADELFGDPEPAGRDTDFDWTPAEAPAAPDPDFSEPDPWAALSRSTLDYGESTLTFEVVRVTPAIARAWLKWNTKNRPLNTKTVNRYARIMAEGRWKLNGEPVIFGANGRLENGQHRLTACIVSGESFVTLVVRGVAADVFDTLDNGKVRSGHDALAIEGYTQTHCLAGTAYLLMVYRADGLTKNREAFPKEPAKIRQVVVENPGLMDSVRASTPCWKLCPASIAAFCHYVFSKQSPEDAARFFEMLATGAELRVTDPVYHLRNRLIQNKGNKAKLQRLTIVALMFKAWNYTREGRQIHQLHWRSEGKNPEAFPSIGD